MIRRNIENGTVVFDDDNGFGKFVGWFQDSKDIALVDLSDGSRIVIHKKFLIEIEK